MMYLNQVKVDGHKFKVNAKLPISDKDLSGDASSTVTAETGIKGKILTVRLGLAFSESDKLRELIDLAEAVDQYGSRIVYTIVNDTAKAYNIRQVKFSGDVSASEVDDVRLWQVSFRLTEYNSVPENVEANRDLGESDTLTDDNDVVTADGINAEGQSEDEAELTGIEKLLSGFIDP